MTQTSDLMRRYTDIVMEGPYDSKVAVTATDSKRVQVAPNVQNKVLQHDQAQQEVDRINSRVRRIEHPTATKVGDTIGGAIGDVVAGTRAAWDAGVDAFTNRNSPMPDPKKPVDVIPDPKRGTSTPRLPSQGGATPPYVGPGTRTPRPQGTSQDSPDRPNRRLEPMIGDEDRPQRVQELPPSVAPPSPVPTRDDWRDAVRGTETDRANSVRETRTVDLLRRLSDIVIEAEVKEVKTAKKTQDNVHKSSNDMMKPYKQ
jgi:hypothetical protein